MPHHYDPELRLKQMSDKFVTGQLKRASEMFTRSKLTGDIGNWQLWNNVIPRDVTWIQVMCQLDPSHQRQYLACCPNASLLNPVASSPIWSQWEVAVATFKRKWASDDALFKALTRDPEGPVLRRIKQTLAELIPKFQTEILAQQQLDTVLTGTFGAQINLISLADPDGLAVGQLGSHVLGRLDWSHWRVKVGWHGTSRPTAAVVRYSEVDVVMKKVPGLIMVEDPLSSSHFWALDANWLYEAYDLMTRLRGSVLASLPDTVINVIMELVQRQVDPIKRP